MYDTATKERSELFADELAAQKGEEDGDDGLGPGADDPYSDPPPEDDPPVDPNSEEATGIPGGRQPGDDRYVEPDGDDPPSGSGGDQPPTPPAALPDDGDGDEESEAQLFLIGDRQLGVKVGGKKPESSVLKFKGSKVDLSGQFDLGQRVLTVDLWQVTGDKNQHTIEKASGAVKASSKVQSATLCSTAKIEDWLAERLEDPALIATVFARLELDVPGDEG